MNPLHLRVFLSPLLLLVAAGGATAQRAAPPVLATGSTVAQVSATSGGRAPLIASDAGFRAGSATELLPPRHPASPLAPPARHVPEPPRSLAARPRRLASTLIGVGVGAAIGAAAFALQADDECFSTGSMCGLAIPLFVLPASVIGGVVGYLVGGR